MTLEHLIDSYGYIVILLGTFLEGETILVLGGIAAKLGYLELPWVIACAFAGTLLGDRFFFFMGRYKGNTFLEKRPTWKGRADKIHQILERFRLPIILGFRFLYGLRTVTPFVLGMSRVPVAEFFILNVIGAALWASVIGILGYALGNGLELILGDIRRYELEIVGGIMITGALLWLIHLFRTKKRYRACNKGTENH